MAIDFKETRKLLEDFDFTKLFVRQLGWSFPSMKKVEQMEVEGEVYQRRMVAEVSGVVVFEIEANREFPNAKMREKIYRETSQLVRENLLIFVDSDRTQSLWYWVKVEGTKIYPRDHVYVRREPCDLLLGKISALQVNLEEVDAVTVVDVAQRLQAGFDIERVTKKFFEEFKLQHSALLDAKLGIQGISKESDRRWYASVILNRLMFVYFLQRKGFLDSQKTLYLQEKLKESQQRGKGLFYAFLRTLFFDGFGKPLDRRSAEIRTLIGNIKYLNGGLFLEHKIEQDYPDIQISDAAFVSIFDLFSRYSWNLDDTVGGNENEINPAVLGYIFEKYINQKAFGAYYTRPEITEYLCDRTINKLILDKVNAKSTRKFDDLTELLLKLDGNICRLLFREILPNLTLLDPACGSGAFLIAAMKTLIYVYSAAIARIEFSSSSDLKDELKKIRKDHPSISYYIKKRIITDNLYGVDIMREATEIAKLRLFLALVSAAQDVGELEPLPNIDFNIMAGNSLVGLIRVDETRFDAVGESKQGNLLQPLASMSYQKILEDKNTSIDLYKKHAFALGEEQGTSQESRLLMLRNDIDEINGQSQKKLNQLLLDEFNYLKIKYEEVQLTGKLKKRVLGIADVDSLEPFHWGYHFDRVLKKGGFDAIITNPPWEIFKPQAKEFFAQHNELVTKNKMDIKEFEKEQKKLLQNPEIAKTWLEYQSQYPYVSAYYRSSEQYKNQISVVNGKKAGTDINLYKLFTEQCFNLLRPGGECGIVIPSGIYTDLGTKQLREMLFNETKVTGLFCLENRKTIFEGVDSRFKIVVLTFEKDSQTTEFPSAFMRLDVEELQRFPSNDSLQISVDMVRRLSPDSLSVMEFKKEVDVQIAEKMLRFPLLGEKIVGKWNLRLANEFHMTNDSHLFKQEPGKGRLPLFTGKMFNQFERTGEKPLYWIDENEGRKALIGRTEDKGQLMNYQGYRWVHRRIARNTDSRTLICYVTPKNVFTEVNSTTLKVIETGISNQQMLFLCATANSFMLDWMIRQKVTTTLNMFYIYQLPVPRLTTGDQYFDEIVQRAAKLICTTPEFDELAVEVGLGSHKDGVTDERERAKLRAELDGIIAHLYGLTEEEFAYILTTFPLVSEAVKEGTMAAYGNNS